jgi:hypothetical protein
MVGKGEGNERPIYEAEKITYRLTGTSHLSKIWNRKVKLYHAHLIQNPSVRSKLLTKKGKINTRRNYINQEREEQNRNTYYESCGVT